VRSEERSIYTPSENPTVQIYVGSSDADPGTSDVSINTVPKGSEVHGWKSVSELPANVGTSDGRNSRRSSGLPTCTVNQTASTAEAGTPGLGQVSVGTPGERRDFRRSELPANVGTSDEHRQRAVRSTGAGTPGLGRDFRLSGVPTYVGTSDVDSHRNLFYVLVKCKSVTHLILFNCLSTLSSSDQLNLHPSL